MGSLEEIGALLGLVAFAGLAVLVFLTFQQARHVRRLRDWAGRAPERAAAEAAAAEGVESSEHEALEPEPEGPGRLAALRQRVSERWVDLDRRMPVDVKILTGGLVAVFLGIAIATSGFGLFGGDTASDTQGAGEERRGGGSNSGGSPRPARPLEVAVLNGTAPPGGVGAPGVADRVATDVEAAGFRVGAIDNAGSFPASVVMFRPEAEAEAEELAEALGSLLTISVAEMTPEIEAVAGGAELAVVVGQGDAGI